MKLSLLSNVGFMGLLSRLKRAEVGILVINLYLRDESRRALIYAKKCARLWGALFSPVLHVDVVRDIPQVFYAVVQRVAIYVVDRFLGPCSIHKEPDQAVKLIKPPIDDKPGIPFMDVMSAWTKDGGIAGFLKSDQRPCGVVIYEKLAQALRGKIGFSHIGILSMSVGQRPASVTSASRVLAFYDL